jgi:hypothetical protein
MVQPVAQQARTHRGAAVVQQREQRRRFLAADGLGQFQIAAGGGIEADEFIFRFGGQRAHVLQAAALRRLGVAQQRAGRAERGAQAIGAEAGQRGHAQLVQQRLVAADHVEVPVRHAVDVAGRVFFKQLAVIAAQDLGWRDAFQFLLDARLTVWLSPENSIRRSAPLASDSQARPAVATLRWLMMHSASSGRSDFPAAGRHRSACRRDHAHHLALDRAFAGGRIADLFADRARFADLDQLGQIAFQRVERHAAHLDRLTARRAARRQRDAEQARRLFRVLEEQLVEIAHAVEHQHVRVLALMPGTAASSG